MVNHLRAIESQPSVVQFDHTSERLDFYFFRFVSGKRLPLHDHPGMHGILKCVAGNFHITSYSEFTGNKSIPLPPSLANYQDRGTFTMYP